MNSYWNQWGLLRARTHENDQNGLLRLAYYHYLSKSEDHLMNALGACSIMNDKGNYAQHPETKYNLDRASHDEMTGVLYFYSLKKDLFHIKQIKRLPYLKYIQFYYNLKAVQTQSKILTWIAGLIIWLGVGQLERAKNGRIDTDSELLALLKLETYKNLGIKQLWIVTGKQL